jgi:hypothetical protein
LYGTEADGSPSDHYCKWCYQEGEFTAKDVDMDEFIEATAQMEADAMGISREEAVSLMATLLPHLDRWKKDNGDEIVNVQHAAMSSGTGVGVATTTTLVTYR